MAAKKPESKPKGPKRLNLGTDYLTLADMLHDQKKGITSVLDKYHELYDRKYDEVKLKEITSYQESFYDVTKSHLAAWGKELDKKAEKDNEEVNPDHKLGFHKAPDAQKRAYSLIEKLAIAGVKAVDPASMGLYVDDKGNVKDKTRLYKFMKEHMFAGQKQVGSVDQLAELIASHPSLMSVFHGTKVEGADELNMQSAALKSFLDTYAANMNSVDAARKDVEGFLQEHGPTHHEAIHKYAAKQLPPGFEMKGLPAAYTENLRIIKDHGKQGGVNPGAYDHVKQSPPKQ